MSEQDLSLRTPIPLSFQSADSILRTKVGIEETYKSIRNRLRKHSAVAVADVVLQAMSIKHSSIVEELRTFPWLKLLIVKWAFQDTAVPLTGTTPMPASELDLMCQQLWDSAAKEGRSGPERNVFLMLRSLLHAQTEFQRKFTWSFLRWPALYVRLPEGKARKQFREAIGMEPETFMDLVFGLYATVLSTEAPMPADPLAPCRPQYGAAVDQLYALFARDLASLRKELQQDRAQRLRGKHELNEFPYLKRFPLLRGPDGRYYCWHRTVFARGVEEAVHLRLSERFEGDYSTNFSKVFEAYVTELAHESGLPLMLESRHKQLMGASSSAVEAIFEGEGCNILVEAKMSLFGDDVLVVDNEQQVFQKTKRVREAIGQGWQVSRQLREHSELQQRFNQPVDYLLVVTSRELLLGSGDKLQRIFPKGQFTYPEDDPDAERRLPLGNIFIISIEDYELVMCCLKEGLVNLSEVVKSAAAANSRPESSKFFFADFLRPYIQKCGLPPLIQHAQDAAEARLSAVFESA